ncbi:TetR/AcrR family transcriptional regulator [Saccharothrix obliqua]|uniref:TetR/AcrR family transcriptional regulator n=1 Tax=Saccharothrix obliqua TaxID=2861747 RepID=UPI001C5D1BCE|nr:TetR/AcrR family transcriptional regulator [Saccharothrix obliqua]MBW4720325.1 TetR/AcrR family transcriptional regulator [Saccharothrix obliqua]
MAREYRQRLRAQSADLTRRRILDAVHRCLVETPSEPVTMEKVAQLADVSRSTIYTAFGTRTGLFAAFAANLLRHIDLTEAVRNPDARRALRDAISGNVHVYATHRDVLRALFSMARLDTAAVGGTIRRLERERAQGLAVLARRLREQGVLRDGITTDHAAHVLWLHTSFDAFDLLLTGRSLNAGTVAAVLIDATTQILCRPNGVAWRTPPWPSRAP